MGLVQSITVLIDEISKRKNKEDDEYKALIDRKTENDTFKTNKKLSIINVKK
jgi:hypothetical protein